jgi:hypothetical protein
MKNTVKKPKVTLTGENGNTLNLLSICSKALKSVGMNDRAKELQQKVFDAKSYEEALALMGEYCDVQ